MATGQRLVVRYHRRGRTARVDPDRDGETPLSRYRTDVFRVAMSGPGDVSGVLALCQSGALDPARIVAILGKTEGNGGVNDFTRE